MLKETLIQIVTKEFGAKKDGGAFVMPEGCELTLFAGLIGETLTIPKVSRLEIADELLVVETVRGEKYVLGREDIRALKGDRTEAARRERCAGFGK